MLMTPAEGMTHFGKGVTGIQQWTGRKSKEMMKQFLPLVAGTVDGSLSALVRVGLDFIYRAHAASMTEDDIQDLKEAMEEFHELKYSVINEKNFTNANRFDHIPKIHMMTHYPEQVQELGTPDGYNTEVPERSHIPNAKEPWRVSNRVNPWQQMIKWMQRREALRLHRRAMDAYFGKDNSAREKKDIDDTDDDDEDEDDEDEDDAEDEGPLAEVEATVTAAAGDGPEAGNDEGGHRGVDVEGQLEGEQLGERLEEGETDTEPDPIVYPGPTRRIAARPTRFRVPGAELVEVYGATDLIPALATCLRKCFDIRPRSYSLALFDLFNVWHRFHLNHTPLPFAPLEPPCRDVVRAKPPLLTATGVVKTPGVFDTTLFVHDRTLFGLRRKRSSAFPLVTCSRFTLLFHPILCLLILFIGRLSRWSHPSHFYPPRPFDMDLLGTPRLRRTIQHFLLHCLSLLASQPSFFLVFAGRQTSIGGHSDHRPHPRLSYCPPVWHFRGRRHLANSPSRPARRWPPFLLQPLL
jgi:uncharacterized protein (DUF697 family)